MRLTFTIFGLLFLGQLVAANAKPPIEAYGERPEIEIMAISETGDKVVMVVRSTERQVANVEIKGDLSARQIRQLQKTLDSEANFSFSTTRFIIHDLNKNESKSVTYNDFNEILSVDFIDDTHLYVRSFHQESSKGPNGDRKLSSSFNDGMILNIEREVIDPIVEESDYSENVPEKRTATNLIAGSPLSYPSVEGNIYIQGMWGSKSSKPKENYLFELSLDTAEAKIIRKGDDATLDWFVKNDGTVLAREDYNNKSNTYKIFSDSNDKLTEIYKLKNAARPPFSIVGIHPETEELLVIATGRYDYLAKLRHDGTLSNALFGVEGKDIDRVLTDANRVVHGVQYSGLTPSYDFFDPDLDKDIDKMTSSASGTSLTIVDNSRDWQKILIKVEGDLTSGMFTLYDRATKRYEKIADTRPTISSSEIGVAIPFEYEARDGLVIQAIATLPPGLEPGVASNLKTIVMPHGGPEAYDSLGFDWMVQYFSNRGYLVVQPNFRGSSGYGPDFVIAGNGEWGNKMQDDITDGLQALVEANLADPNRVCIVGASYGGYAALAGGAFTPDLYKCVVAIAPVTDLAKMLKEEKRSLGRQHWVVDYWEERMADGEARKKKLNSISPAKHASSFQAPVLLLHGDLDTVVPIVQSKIMAKALKRADKNVEFITLETGNHWLTKSPVRLQTLQAASDFVEQHIGD